ncbi:MAG: DUF3034 family protein [Gammaproteobacteria bacterium]|nr:DUF3034 family protein [Gammaproteobacteria bacterium]
MNDILHRRRTARAAALLAWIALCPAPSFAGGRLGFTGAVSQIEGAAGGGLVPWALIAGLGTDTELGGAAFATYASTADFSLRTAGISAGLDNRVEVSAARQRFDAGSVIPGLTLGQDIVGVKVRLAGDAIFAPDRLMPQLAIGALYKRTLDYGAVPRAVGASAGHDVDIYLAATKLYFGAVAGRNLLIDATLRRTRANQFGLLGFGGDRGGYMLAPELSAAVFVNDTLLVGAEYRAKPSDLGAFRESGARDLFAAWGPQKDLTVTAAWVDLGPIAGKAPQRGVYVSFWIGI